MFFQSIMIHAEKIVTKLGNSSNEKAMSGTIVIFTFDFCYLEFYL